MVNVEGPKTAMNGVHRFRGQEKKKEHVGSGYRLSHAQLFHAFMTIRVAQSMPMAAPMAASTPAAEISKAAKAPFDFLEVLVEDELLPVLEPEAVPLFAAVVVEG
jgi:hypothetical protein